MNKEQRTAIFPGSFDPFTKGHADLVERGLRLFDSLIIAVGYNEQKQGWIPTEERVRALKELYANDSRIMVEAYKTLTTDFAKEKNATFILRGVRSVKDYEYEQQIALVNQQLTGIETVILFANPTLGHISSSMARELDHFGHDITSFLPESLQYEKSGSTKESHKHNHV